ncbi:MAG: hypothetical protein H6740_17810 [Alphaproteobacteria bacterium]|nr:hypothetical protein [Alphaproteobacteria bacterium]
MILSLLLACVPPPPPPQAAPTFVEGGELITSGPVDERVSDAPADLVLFYGGEHKGSLETCGCPHRPRGSVTRMQSYLDAARAAQPDTPDLLLMGGYWLEDAQAPDGGLRADAPVMNRWMLEGLAAVKVDAANLTWHDVPGWLALEERPAWAVSANVVAAKPGAPAPPTTLVLEREGLRIGVVGVTSLGSTLGEVGGLRVVDGYRPAKEALLALAPQVDLLVLLSYQSTDIARALVEAVPELDVVIDTGTYRSFDAPILLGETIWVRSHYQTMRLGELRLLRREDGGWALGLDRKIDLDPEVPDAPELEALMQAARDEIEATQRELFGG